MLTTLSLQNSVLRRLESAELAALGVIEPVTLSPGDPLEKSGEPLSHVYFFETAIAKVIGPAPLETGVAVIGREGLTGTGLLLGEVTSTFDTITLLGGSAFRVDLTRLQAATDAHSGLRGELQKFEGAMLIQVMKTSVANARLDITQRVAGWLLLIADRYGETFAISHDQIAALVGSRRSGVTLAMHALENAGLIENRRRNLKISDRSQLDAYVRRSFAP